MCVYDIYVYESPFYKLLKLLRMIFNIRSDSLTLLSLKKFCHDNNRL